MKRATSIEVLLRKTREDFANLKQAYESSLHEQIVRENLKIEIKHIFEDLRSCLDYLAQELHEAFCKGANKPRLLYFPIRQTATEFAKVIGQDFPGLEASCKPVFEIIESLQPFRDPWLGQFNALNNKNKHQDLVEQSRTESRRVTVTRPGGGTVSWGPGVTFSGDVKVMGVPIDPATQLPVPNSVATTKVTTWVDFRFRDGGQSVLPFIASSIERVETTYRAIAKYC